MSQSKTLTLKIINDQDTLETLSKGRSMSEEEKELIRFIAKTAVQEYVREMKAVTQVNHDRVLRLPEVKRLTGLGRSSIYLYIERGLFPKPLRLGTRSVGWRENEITHWIEKRAANSS